MSKYKLANGWTKATVMEQVKKYNNGSRASSGKECVYLATDGNRCAIGCFIPDGSEALASRATVTDILKDYPELVHLMPFDNRQAIVAFQAAHDRAPCGDNVHATIQTFLNDKVEE